MWVRFYIWKSDMKRKFWRGVSKFAMRRGYPWFDYSSYFAHMQDWFDYASKRYAERGTCVGSERVAKQMLVASEVCRRLSTGYIEDNTHLIVFGPEKHTAPRKLPWVITDDERRKYKTLHRLQEESYKYHLDLLTKIISKHSMYWWD